MDFNSKERKTFISDNRKLFLNLKDDLNLLSSLKELPSSKRRDSLIASIESSFNPEEAKSQKQALIDETELLSKRKAMLIAELQSMRQQLESERSSFDSELAQFYRDHPIIALFSKRT